MRHNPNEFAWSDSARGREREREHQKMPIEPLYGPRTTPRWCWALMGITLGAGFLWAIGAVSLFLFGVILVPAVLLLIALRGLGEL